MFFRYILALMHIYPCTTLSEEQKTQITGVQQLCFAEEALENEAFLSNELNYDKQVPCFFLGYEGNELVSYLCAFFPDSHEVEFNGGTHPAYQCQGRFSALVREALTVYRQLAFEQALFQCERNAEKAHTYLQSRYPQIARSEYVMVLKKQNWQAMDCPGVLEEISHANRNHAKAILISEMGMSEQASTEEVDFLLSQSGRKGFLYRIGDQYLGMVNSREENPEQAMIHGVVIRKPHRGQGHGRNLLTHILGRLFTTYRIVTLEVDSENPPALHLYRTSGFSVVNQVDYHRLILR